MLHPIYRVRIPYSKFHLQKPCPNIDKNTSRWAGQTRFFSLVLILRGRAPFGQHQESRPLARSNDIPVLNGFVNPIDWDQNQSDLSDLALSMRRVTGSPWIAHSGFEWIRKPNRLKPEPIRFVRLDSKHAQSVHESRSSGVGHGQRSRFLVLTKTSAASGYENASPSQWRQQRNRGSLIRMRTWCLEIFWRHKHANEENTPSLFSCFLRWNFLKVCILHDIDSYFTI